MSPHSKGLILYSDLYILCIFSSVCPGPTFLFPIFFFSPITLSSEIKSHPLNHAVSFPMSPPDRGSGFPSEESAPEHTHDHTAWSKNHTWSSPNLFHFPSSSLLCSYLHLISCSRRGEGEWTGRRGLRSERGWKRRIRVMTDLGRESDDYQQMNRWKRDCGIGGFESLERKQQSDFWKESQVMTCAEVTVGL